MKTKVVFRRWKSDGSVIAIFPQFHGRIPYQCLSYEHLRQHGDCAPFHVLKETFECGPTEYQSLKEELEDIGYKLEVIHENQKKTIADLLERNESWWLEE